MDTETLTAQNEQTARPYTYDHIPQLRELLPATGGIPGVLYAQIAVHNARKAQDEGWGDMYGNLAIYTVTGPKGSVDCKLVCQGTPIPGQSPGSGSRVCLIDEAIYQLTGHEHPSMAGQTRHERADKPLEAANPIPTKRGPGRPKKEATPTE